jgi:hypothetical protein
MTRGEESEAARSISVGAGDEAATVILQHVPDDRNAFAAFRGATQRLVDARNGAVARFHRAAHVTIRETIAKTDIHRRT